MCVFLVCPTSVFSLSIKPVHECLKPALLLMTSKGQRVWFHKKSLCKKLSYSSLDLNY